MQSESDPTIDLTSRMRDMELEDTKILEYAVELARERNEQRREMQRHLQLNKD